MNIAKLVVEAHTTSRAHGFWEGPLNTDVSMKFALIHSELAEALEEYRLTDEKRGGPLGTVLYSCAVRDPTQGHHNATGRFYSDGITEPACCGKPAKPEGFTVELADAAIRIFDLIGGLNITEAAEALWQGTEFTADDMRAITNNNLAVSAWRAGRGGRFLNQLHTCVAKASIGWEEPDYDECARYLVYALAGLRRLATLVAAAPDPLGDDLECAIAIKMAYNAGREHMHGKRC